jgi:phage-related protein
MKRLDFYRLESGRCPVEEFLDGLPDRQVKKILWVLRIVRDFDPVPSQYFAKLSTKDDIWEVRVQVGGDMFRLLGFLHQSDLIILTSVFQKKTQKTPRHEIELAAARKRDYLERARR